MRLAQKTATLVASGKVYVARIKVRQFFLCQDSLQELFHLPDPLPEKIRILLHDEPSSDRVSIGRWDGYRTVLQIDGVHTKTYCSFREWLLPYLNEHGTVYAEVWY